MITPADQQPFLKQSAHHSPSARLSHLRKADRAQGLCHLTLTLSYNAAGNQQAAGERRLNASGAIDKTTSATILATIS